MDDLPRDFHAKYKARTELALASLDALFKSSDDKVTFIAIAAGMLVRDIKHNTQQNVLPLLQYRLRKAISSPSLDRNFPDHSSAQLLEEAGMTEDAARQRRLLQEMMR